MMSCSTEKDLVEWLSEEFDEREILACLSILETALQTDEWRGESYPKDDCVEDVERLRRALIETRTKEGREDKRERRNLIVGLVPPPTGPQQSSHREHSIGSRYMPA